MLPGLTSATRKSACLASATRWKDSCPPWPHDRPSDSVASTAPGNAAPSTSMPFSTSTAKRRSGPRPNTAEVPPTTCSVPVPRSTNAAAAAGTGVAGDGGDDGDGDDRGEVDDADEDEDDDADDAAEDAAGSGRAGPAPGAGPASTRSVRVATVAGVSSGTANARQPRSRRRTRPNRPCPAAARVTPAGCHGA